MSLMKTQYHHQIHLHGAVSNSIEGETLLSSISCSLEKNPYELGDFDYVVPSINLDNNGENLEDLDKLEGVQATNSESAMGPSKTEKKKVDSRKRDNCCRRVVESIAFDAGIMFVIFINTMIIVYEDMYNVNDNPAGFVLEVLFTLIYLAEFVLKYGYQYFFDYFFDPWNILDFSLLIAGIVGLVFMMMSLQSDTSDIASIAHQPSAQDRQIGAIDQDFEVSQDPVCRHDEQSGRFGCCHEDAAHKHAAMLHGGAH